MRSNPKESRLSRVALVNDPAARKIALQVLLLALLLFAAYSGFRNAAANLANQRIASGFGFLDQSAGFGIAQALIPWNEAMSYGRAYIVGLLNTLLVSVIAIVFGTVLGFVVGIARLAPNWIISRLAKWYVEIIRNLPLLFQILFWYLAVLAVMPAPRSALSLNGVVFVSQRGITLPQPELQAGAGLFAGAAVIAIGALAALSRWSRRRRMATGSGLPKWVPAVAAIAVVAAVALIGALAGPPVSFVLPQQGRFNLSGGLTMIPELTAFVVALTAYSAAFIGEIVRAGIQAVPKGQTEAGRSLGLPGGLILRRVVIPQALRVMVPLLTSQYLNIVKNSSLGVSIGYPELVSVGGTMLNQTGQAIEIVAIWMATYLTISLLTSLFMNWYNARIALVDR